MLALTDRPWDYDADMRRLWLIPCYVPSAVHLMDLSGGGGFVSCSGGVGSGEQVQLCIEDMDDPTPVLANIRWRRGETQKRPQHGFGLHFLNIRPGQLRELAERFLGLRAGAA